MASEETLLSRHLRRLLPAAVRPAIVHTFATVRSYFWSNDDWEVASCTADTSLNQQVGDSIPARLTKCRGNRGIEFQRSPRHVRETDARQKRALRWSSTIVQWGARRCAACRIFSLPSQVERKMSRGTFPRREFRGCCPPHFLACVKISTLRGNCSQRSLANLVVKAWRSPDPASPRRARAS